MPAFDTNDSPINPDHFVNKLVGALCEVTFTLKHYAIGAQKSSKEGESYVEAHDIFSAQVETVAVLKNPPTIVRSPYKGRIIKRPHHRPQIPTREEQVNAAAAFISNPDVGSSSTGYGIHAQAPASASSINPTNPTSVNTPPPPYAAQLASAGSAASILTLTSDDEDRSITQVSSLKRKNSD